MNIDSEKLKLACQQCKIDTLDDDELVFLHEYHKIILPIAMALKLLEGNRLTFGAYLPTLIGLRLNLGKMNAFKFVYCQPLLVAVSNGFEERFASVLDIFHVDGKWIPLYIAMITDPQYKLNFLGMRTIPAHISEKVRRILFNAGKEVSPKKNTSESMETSCANQSVNANTMRTSTGNFHLKFTSTYCLIRSCFQMFLERHFSLLIENDVTASLASAIDIDLNLVNEIDEYLLAKTTTNLDNLSKYPTIRKLYMKFNCIRPSEAICERLFSYAGMFDPMDRY